MDADQIKAAKALSLKPNGIFKDLSYPFNYQKKGSLLMLLRPRMVLGDDVGLGKTLQCVLACSYIKAANPTTKFLIFTEMTAFGQWAKTFRDHTPSLKVKLINTELYPDPQQRIAVMRGHGADVVLSSYSQLYDYYKYLKEGMQPRWVGIFDEPDLFKSTDSVAHRHAYDLVNGEGGAARVYGATATIVGNRLTEAFGILRIVAPGTLGGYKEFEEGYLKTKRFKKRKRVVGYKNLDEFRRRIEPVFFGRLQDDPEVEQELPEVITTDLPIIMSKAQSWKVVEAMDKILEMPSGEVKQLSVLPAMTYAQILTDDPRVKGFDIVGAKTTALLETLTGSLSEQRVIISSKFRTVVDLLQERIQAAGLETVRITGTESLSEKMASKDRFMSDGSDRVNILLMTAAGRKAIDLQKGGHLFFFDLPWAYDLYRQTVGRIKRTGSVHKRVGVYRMMGELHPEVASQVGTEKTIDHHTLKILMEKFKLWKGLTGDVKEIEATDTDVADIYEQIKSSHRVAA